MTTRSALWIGDRVSGTNRYTGDRVTGVLTSKETSVMDGLDYAVVEKSDGTGDQYIRLDDLSGPRRCYRPTPSGEWGADQTTCANCGRQLYANGPYDTDRLTHDPTRPASRYR